MNEPQTHTLQAVVVLVVDDSPDDRFILSRALSRTGLSVRVFEAEDGQEAIDFLGHRGRFSNPEASPTPDLLLLDLKLPGVNGFEVLEWLRQNPHHAPRRIVVLSGSELDRDVLRARELGASTYLNKPPTPEQLRQLLCQELGLAA